MSVADVRLRGWKSIATHLGVTQSTAMRWARDPDFPVLRSTSGGSVYALPADLDGWLARRDADHDAESAGAQPHDLARPATHSPAGVRRGASALVVVLAAVILLVAAGAILRAPPPATVATPPEASRMLLDASEQWAARTPASLARAVAGFQAIVARYPDLPAGFTGLADSYLLSCEYASMPRAEAFEKAHAAARTALALAPNDPAAHRIIGFLGYWTNRDIDRAKPDFDASIAGSAPGYLAHLWYGNALIDAGRIADGIAQLERARALTPDSPVVLTDYAIALWQSGDEAGALQRLAEVGRRFPQLSSAPGTAALFRLARGDVADYLRESERWSRLIGDPVQAARLAREKAAFAAGGGTATLRTIAAAPPIASPFWHGGTLPSAIAASLLGGRARLIAILSQPGIDRQNWRPLRFPTEPFRRWRRDSRVAPLVERAFGVPVTTLFAG